MRLKKILSAVGIIFIAFMSLSDFKIYAEETTGLITKCSLSCEKSDNNTLRISAKTQASGIMSEIGFENIIIQYSDDGINWYNEKNIGSMTKYNANHYCVDGVTAKISGGHFYRVTCTHTATGNLFTGGDKFTQTAVHFSKYISVGNNETFGTEIGTEAIHDISTTLSTVSTTSTSSVLTTSSDVSTNLSTVSTSADTTTAVNSQQQSSQSDSSGKTNIIRIYEYFGDGSPITGAAAPTAAVFVLILAASAALKSKKN